jgi:hypothetical protein
LYIGTPSTIVSCGLHLGDQRVVQRHAGGLLGVRWSAG